ncbi:MAG TPA: archease [Rubrobacteraceae bacterium]|nr:archease [Rubrobacteraceae bacterium]
MIRMLDHTADVGFELEAPSVEALFEEARRALVMIVLENPPEHGRGEKEIRLSGPDLETLLVRWLNELVYLLQDLRFVPVGSRIGIREAGGVWFALEASLSGAPLEPQEQGFTGEIKSATFHGLEVQSGSGGWRARVILDV